MVPAKPVRGYFQLLFVSILSLYLELVLIRWIGSEVRIFAYFKNLVLVSCFLGLGTGFVLKRYKPGLIVSLILMAFLAIVAHPSAHYAGISLRSVPEYLAVFPEFHTWSLVDDIHYAKIAAGFAMISAVSVILAAIFVPFGQILAEIFEKSDNRIRDYSINLAGSLFGTWAFVVMSFLSTPPWMWFLTAAAGIVSFMETGKRSIKTIVGLALLIPIVALTIEKDSGSSSIFWSPYQKLRLYEGTANIDQARSITVQRLNVNSVFYMLLLDLSIEQFRRYPDLYAIEAAPYYPYDLPYRFQTKPDRVLIVGAGGGNDAAAAIRNGAEMIDAVEIDPVIARIGVKNHPESPYSNPKVQLIVDDARSFFKKTTARYDLITFALLDSHTLTSNYTNINLDSYVYTKESFTEAKRLLADGGIVALSFEVAHPWMGLKLNRLITEVFGEPPLIINNYSKQVLQGTGGTLFLCGDMNRIKRVIASDQKLKTYLADKIIPPENYRALEAVYEFSTPSDDWPYLYLQKRQIPSLHSVMISIICLMMLLVVKFSIRGGASMSWHFLFLGAGFMLVEVHSISKAALLFGSTWVVNAVIISAIMTMILFANLVVLRRPVNSLRWWYVCLFVSLLFSYVVPVSELIVGNYVLRGIVAGSMYSMPMFFAGVIYASSINKVISVEAAMASNMFGAAIGGMLENVSYLVGLKFVVAIAIVLYLASLVGLRNMPVRSGR